MSKKYFFMQGGLGNQICILSKAYEEYYKGSNVIIDLSSYLFNPYRQFKLRDYFDLSNFKILNGNVISYLIFRILNKVMEIFNKTKINFFLLDKTFYFGYFQDSIDSRIYHLIRHFKFNEINEHNTLCIHLRRGDYTLNKFKKFHGIVRIKDVLNVIKRNKKIISTFSKISVITEDYNINFPNSINGIPSTIFSGSDHEAFLHMISAKGLIASNSTFSLMAGLLRNKFFFVIPSQWFLKSNSDFLGKSFKRYPCTLL